jgi:hypothetical protein
MVSDVALKVEAIGPMDAHFWSFRPTAPLIPVTLKRQRS